MLFVIKSAIVVRALRAVKDIGLFGNLEAAKVLELEREVLNTNIHFILYI